MFQVHSKVIQLYIYTYIICQIIFHYRYFKRLTKELQLPVLYSNLCCLLHTFFKKLEIYHSIHTKSNKRNQNVINFLVRQTICFLKYIYYTY